MITALTITFDILKDYYVLENYIFTFLLKYNKIGCVYVV